MSVHGGKTIFIIVSVHRLPLHHVDVRTEGTKAVVDETAEGLCAN